MIEKCHFKVGFGPVHKVFASGQAIRAASYAVLRPTEHGSFPSRTQKRSLCGLAASSGVSNPRDESNIRPFNPRHPRLGFQSASYAG